MAFDKTLPIEGALAPTYNNIMRADKIALEAALNAYTYFETGGTQTGQPRQGSSRPYFQDSAPTTRLDGDHFDSTDLGTLWIDSNSSPDNQVNFLSAADGAGTNVWTPISTEIIAVLVAAIHIWAAVQTFSEIPVFTKGLYANNAYLTARNAAGDGNVNLIKADGGDVPTVPDDTANTTSGAPTTDASLANKKYVDDAIDTDIATLTALGLGKIKTGTYNGDGTSDRSITGVGFQPTVLVLIDTAHGSAFGWGIKTDQDTGESSHYGSGNYATELINSLDADGFTLGTTHAYVNNVDTRKYIWIAFAPTS